MKVITQSVEQCKATAAKVNISVRYSTVQLSQFRYSGKALQYLYHPSLTLPSGLPESSPITACVEQTWVFFGFLLRKEGSKTPCTAGNMDNVSWKSELLTGAWQGTVKWQKRPNTLGLWVVTSVQIIDGSLCWITQCKHIILESYSIALPLCYFSWATLIFIAAAEIKPVSLKCGVTQESLLFLGLSQ